MGSRDRTGWLRTQSDANPSPPIDSLPNREINREFCRFRLCAAILALQSLSEFRRATAKFPIQQIREFFIGNREFFLVSSKYNKNDVGRLAGRILSRFAGTMVQRSAPSSSLPADTLHAIAGSGAETRSPGEPQACSSIMRARTSAASW